MAADMAISFDNSLSLSLAGQHQLELDEDWIRRLKQAGRQTETRLRVQLASTSAWRALASDRVKHFQAVQSFIGQIYVVVSSVLPEEATVDVVIEVLFGEREMHRTGNVDSRDANTSVLSETSHSLEEVGSRTDKKAESESEPVATQPETVALGGTFDHLHAGHKILLTMACWLARRRVIVGITDDVLLGSKQYKDLLQSLDVRTAAVRSFLGLCCPQIQHDTPALQDVYGPTAVDPDVQAVIVSEETRGGASAIAEKRRENNLCQLDTYVINVITPESFLDVENISKEDMLKLKMGSTQIRRRLKERQDDAQKT